MRRFVFSLLAIGLIGGMFTLDDAFAARASKDENNAEKLFKSMVTALEIKDFEAYKSIVDASLLSQENSEQAFEAFSATYNERFGKVLEYKYLDTLRKTDGVMVLWKARFEKSNGDILVICVLKPQDDNSQKIFRFTLE